MRCALAGIAVLAATAALSGCGGGQPKSQEPAPPPVGRQVHDVLLAATDGPGMNGQPALPYVDVGVCTGPADGGAGAYRCSTTPRGRSGVRTVVVDVKADGSWQSEMFPVETTLQGRRTTAQRGVWGAGLRLAR